MRYRVLYEAPFTATLMRFFGALIMLPFGLLIASGLVFGGPKNVVDIYTEGRREVTTLLMNVPTALFSLAFGLFLTYALLRHGGGSLFDLFGARTTVIGRLERKWTGRGGKGGLRYFIAVAGEQIEVSKAAYDIAREGMSVRATCGRFERDLTELAEAES